jgi:ribosomal protein L34E
MLICNCGWIGANLVPHKDKKAHCPKCSLVFNGIPAERAIVMSREQEKRLQEKARKGIWTSCITKEEYRAKSHMPSIY